MNTLSGKSLFFFSKIIVLVISVLFISGCDESTNGCFISCDCGYEVSDNCTCIFTADCPQNLSWNQDSCKCVGGNYMTATIISSTIDHLFTTSDMEIDFKGDTLRIMGYDDPADEWIVIEVVDENGADIIAGSQYTLDATHGYTNIHFPFASD